MTFVVTEESVNFKPPNDQPYATLEAHALGWDIFGDVCHWTLRLLEGQLILTNGLAARYEIGSVDDCVRLSLGFLKFSKLYFVVETTQGVSKIFSYDLNEKTLTAVREFADIRQLTLCYAPAFEKNQLLFGGVLTDKGVVFGQMTDSDVKYEIVQPHQDTHLLRIHRFGLTTTNQLKIEVVIVSES